GGEVKFTVVVRNPTPGPVTLTKLTDSVFGNLDHNAPASDRSWITSECETDVRLEASGQPGDSYTCRFVGHVNASPDKPHTDTVTAELRELVGARREGDPPATAKGQAVRPWIGGEKTADPTLLEKPGDVTYRVVITNTSPATSDTVTINELGDSLFGDLIRGS